MCRKTSMPVKISRILHAGYVFEHQGLSIAFDPIFENPFSRNCFAFPNVQFQVNEIGSLNFAAVFISHFHDDHCSLESLNLLNRRIPIYLYCHDNELFQMIESLGFETVQSLELNRKYKIGSFEITPHRALDADVDSVFQIQVGDLNILNLVDAWLDPTTLELLARQNPWDLVLWPFQNLKELDVLSPSRASWGTARLAGQAPETIPPEFLEHLGSLNPRFLVPSACQFRHEDWSWYNQALFPITYLDFQRYIEQNLPACSVIRMNPSQSFLLGKDTFCQIDPLSWVIPVGPQDVDYTPAYEKTPPTAAHMASHFPPLPREHRQLVLNYCRLGLADRLSKDELLTDSFFRVPRIWKLIIYGNDYKKSVFTFEICKGRIHLIAESLDHSDLASREVKDPRPCAWQTEVSEFKLYSCLETGESLTSMYLRINDCVFESDVEQDLTGVDLLIDPLVQSLFSHSPLEYQRAQLRRIQKHSNPVEN